MDYATLGNKENYTVFKYSDRVIRFRAPYSLEKYTRIKKWDNGYIVAAAKYVHNADEEEEYIDLVPILEDLYIDSEDFLKGIKEVRIENA